MATEYTKTFTTDASLVWNPVVGSLELTFNDFILEVAILGGLADYGVNADEEAQIPIDAHDLSQCKRIVNNALRMFISMSPADGWHWQKKRCRITFAPEGDGPDNVDGESYRYLLPVGFNGSYSGPITYDTNTNNIPYIEWVSEATIRQYKSSVTYTGDPKWAAIRTSQLDSRYELMVYPYPSRAYTVVFNWTQTRNKFVNLTDVTPMGALFDNDFLAACRKTAEVEFENIQGNGGFITAWEKTNLPNAWKLDAQSTPRRLGTDRRDGLSHQFDRYWHPITYNGE